MRAFSSRRPVALLCAALLGLLAPSARAIDLLGEKIQIHGAFEEQIRTISDDFNAHLDLTQWYHVLNLEIDLQIAPDGFGPVDSVSGYLGLEARYDCVWTRACGLSGGSNVFGNRSKVLPERLSQAKNAGFAGVQRYQDAFYRQPDGKIKTLQQYAPIPVTGSAVVPSLPGISVPFRGFNQLPSIDTLFAVRQVVNNTEYLPAFYTFQRYLKYGFALRGIRGTEDSMGTQSMPWDPKDDIDPQGTLADRVNPFRPGDVNPITGLAGSTALPYRPAPNFAPLGGPVDQAKGLFYPSKPYAQYLRDGGSDPFQQNFSQNELAWNWGASQQQTKVLKEAYLDINLLEGSLFLRLGRQTIVWGKTELFATTDQFNPNDLALASLPKLEESRIPIWAARAIYSFYEVGPLQDVRLEVALDLDTFYPDDLGRCGEAYTPNPVCNKTYGLLAHGIAGLGIAGEDRPPQWWNDAKGLQGGARLEFRWDRFSFALVDFYNYEKIPYAARLTTFSRNVDPSSGRARRINDNGTCITGNEPSCLQGGNDALRNSSLNQQYFATICSASVGFSSLDRSVCAQSVLTSQKLQAGASITQLVSQFAAGSPNGIGIIAGSGFNGTASRIPLVSLSIDAGDGTPTGVFSGAAQLPFLNFALPGFAANHNQFQTLAQVFTTQQQALLGCGPLYGTTCDGGKVGAPGPGPGGIDLLNAEASALVQSWLGFDGTGTKLRLATDASAPQPGTIGFRGGPVCTRVLPNGQQVMLPGCRGPSDKGYNPAVDGPNPGTTSIGFPAGVGGTPALGDPSLGPIGFTQGQPYTGQTWRSEMAAFSWNLQMVLVAFSDLVTTPGVNPRLGFDINNAYRTDGCSYVLPQLCSAVRALWAVTGVTRNTLNAGGNPLYGRRDFVWAGGGDAVLSYQRRNILGLSSDFAEDVTKTNWGVEFTWVNRQAFEDASQYDNISKPGTLNLTVSVDRPTFVNFLNTSRTLFFNSQWFFQYIPDYKNSFTTNGPWNVLFTFTTQTGYFQDRLLPGVTWVYDMKSNSGAALPEIQYRFTESFSMTLGFALFWGRYQSKQYPLNPLSLDNQAGKDSYSTWVENGISVVRQRDEAFFNLRYTF
jgi:hypothetical protein